MGYKISEFSNISGVSAANIRYYEQRGYPTPDRTDSGYRQYRFEDSYRINVFNSLLAHGFGVSEAISLLEPHPAGDLVSRLDGIDRGIEEQIRFLRKKLEWNHILQDVLAHADGELSRIHEVRVPELCYLKCTEGFDHAPSLENGALLARWVDALPYCHYACRARSEAKFTMGMIMEMKDAEEFGLNDPGTEVIPESDYYVLLLPGVDEVKELREDRRIQLLKEKGWRMPDEVIHVYLMLQTEEYGPDLNYVLLKK